MTHILVRLALIEKQQNEVMEDLKKYLRKHEDDALLKLSKHLSSEEVRVRFTSWNLDEVPNVESSWRVTESQIMKVLSSRLREFIQQWEEDNQVFTNARESLVQHFQQRYNFVEEQLRNLQDAVTADNVIRIIVSTDSGMSLGEKIVIGVTSPIWFPLGLVALVIGAPIFGALAIKEKLEDKGKIKKYEENRCAFMAKKSAACLDVVKNDEMVLRSFVRNQLEDARLCLRQIKARIPELIQADKMLCEQLIDETRSIKEIQKLYQPIMDEGSRLRGHLAVFGILEVRASDISSEELDWKQNASSRLGCGAFGNVYQGTMRRHGFVQPVALKVCSEVLHAKNACEILAEVELLR